ncbi:unnamed protein product [Ceutorhynchus assimilis]|uniref:Uncharacterized protein n=1 Tax=Ceutorhynchus assimilis TaxID=467358 RepID=A0A9N9MKU8_9CUCU|nr:unnamed protein product [Ceutorhynchus assimilis]
MDATHEIFCHGLLLQRKAIQNNISELAAKHPNLANDVKKKFEDTSSEFRIVSDDLLQYVCGKRAEIIESRRRLYETPNENAAKILRDIPPSGTFLFDENQIKELYTHQDNTTQLIFRYNERPPSSYDYDNRSSIYRVQKRYFESTSEGNLQDDTWQRKRTFKPKSKYDKKQNIPSTYTNSGMSNTDKKARNHRV